MTSVDGRPQVSDLHRLGVEIAMVIGGVLFADRPLLDKSVRERWNDYGIGLLLQGDLKTAQAVFRHVTAMDPAYVDGPVNVARAQLRVQFTDHDAADEGFPDWSWPEFVAFYCDTFRVSSETTVTYIRWRYLDGESR